LEQALFQEGTAAAVEYLFEAPWKGPLPPQETPLTDRKRWEAALLDARARQADLAVVGQLHSVFRTAGGGLTIKLTVRVISTQDGRVIWYGRKRADWIRRFPIEDCYLNLAWSLVRDWQAKKN
jgi:hypothetical protein